MTHRLWIHVCLLAAIISLASLPSADAQVTSGSIMGNAAPSNTNQRIHRSRDDIRAARLAK